MNPRKIILPKSVPDLMNPARMADLGRGFEIVNALANMRLQVRNAAGQSIGSGVMQLSGTTALLQATTNITGLGPNEVNAQILVVGCGGGGGWFGGGGAGELIYEPVYLLNDTASYSILVGVGGTGGSEFVQGGNGQNSSFNSVLNAAGGGGGGRKAANGSPGGSGGGGGANVLIGQVWFGGVSTASQGFGNGGGATTGVANSPCGGGGGAGRFGNNGDGSGTTGIGGIGLQYSISGTPTYYAGGGGGGAFVTGTGVGGLGGGGAGQQGPASIGGNGTNSLGGGGGGGGTGGVGGSGVIIVRYPGAARFTGGAITHSAGDTIHTFLTNDTLAPL